MKTKLPLLILFVLLITIPAKAQIASYLHLVAIGSDGTETIEADDSESSLEDFRGLMQKNFPFNQKEITAIELNEDQNRNIELFLSNTFELSESDDLFVLGIFGAWESGNFVSEKETKISPDYIRNFLEYLPAKTVLAIIVSPDAFSFPMELFGAQNTDFAGGKIICALKNNTENDYDDVLSSLISVLDDLADSGSEYAGPDGNITLSEWLSEFNKLLLEEEIIPEYYKLSSGPDYIINAINK